MMTQHAVVRMVRFMNVMMLLGILCILAGAFYLEYSLHELPCPLCLLQRFGFLAMTLGLLMNLRLGFHPGYYGMVILSAMFTGLVALRQFNLHVIPGTGAYGSPILGMHLYTWAFIISMLIVVVVAVLQSVGRQYQTTTPMSPAGKRLTHWLFLLVTLMLLANIATIVLECGYQLYCPENPVKYELLG
jgi:disulfide bond formation protein DsbB